ncbi:hypothetical protein K438DRAFT_1933545 [Mycena galopus ATCC 62051]|nr:hypothetical protein K438DRAFT_1933545 [Mycena galopus ATCC 62051]
MWAKGKQIGPRNLQNGSATAKKPSSGRADKIPGRWSAGGRAMGTPRRADAERRVRDAGGLGATEEDVVAMVAARILLGEVGEWTQKQKQRQAAGSLEETRLCSLEKGSRVRGFASASGKRKQVRRGREPCGWVPGRCEGRYESAVGVERCRGGLRVWVWVWRCRGKEPVVKGTVRAGASEFCSSVVQVLGKEIKGAGEGPCRPRSQISWVESGVDGRDSSESLLACGGSSSSSDDSKNADESGVGEGGAGVLGDSASLSAGDWSGCAVGVGDIRSLSASPSASIASSSGASPYGKNVWSSTSSSLPPGASTGATSLNPSSHFAIEMHGDIFAMRTACQEMAGTSQRTRPSR